MVLESVDHAAEAVLPLALLDQNALQSAVNMLFENAPVDAQGSEQVGYCFLEEDGFCVCVVSRVVVEWGT